MIHPGDTPLMPTSSPGRLSTASLSELYDLLEALDQLERLQTLPDKVAYPQVGVLFGRFRLDSKLGAGRFGLVFRAHDPTLNRTVVIKVPQPAVLTDPDLRERFVREAKAAARLDHPGVVPVFDAGDVRGLAYLAAGFVDGPTLGEWFAALPAPPDPTAAARLVADLARALQHAHDRGVLHCDLKPANVLLDRSGEVGPGVPGVGCPRVTDFGLARLIEDDPALSKTFQVVGTPLYMAPEQARGDRRGLTAQADIYALGAVLYELLAGRPPHAGGTSAEILLRLQANDPVRPRKLNPGVPRDLDAVCMKCLEKDPGRRYATAADLAADLDRFLAGRPVQARAIGLGTAAARWVRRSPVLAGLVALTLASVVTAGGLAVHFHVARLEDRLAVGHAQSKAETADYYATLDRVRQRRLARSPGWVQANRGDLARVAGLPVAHDDLPALRTEATAALAGFDLPEPRVVAENFSAHPVEFSPDGRELALGQWLADDSGTCEVRLLDPQTGRTLDRFRFPADPDWERRYNKPNTDDCRAIAFSADGRWLVAGTRSGWVLAWDRRLGTREPVRRRASVPLAEPRDELVSGLAFTPNGRGLVVAGGTTVSVWDVDNDWSLVRREVGELYGNIVRPARPGDPVVALLDGARVHVHEEPLGLSRGEPHDFHIAAATPGSRVLVARDLDPSKLRLFDLDAGSRIGALALPDDDRAEDGAIMSLAVSPDRTFVAASAEHAGHLKLWSLQEGRVLSARILRGGSLRMAFAPDGRTLAVAEDSRTLLYAIPEPAVATEIARQKLPIRDAAVAPGGRYVATVAEFPGAAGRATVWHDDGAGGVLRPAADWPVSPSPRHNNRWQIAVADRGRVAYSREFAVYERADFDGPETRHDVVHDLKDLRTGPDGRTWYCARGGPYQRLGDAGLSAAEKAAADAHALAVAPGATVTVIGADDGTVVRVPAPGTRADARWHVFDDKATAVALSPDERTAVAGSATGEVAVLDVPTGRVKFRIAKAHQDAVESAAFGPDGWFATGSWDRTVRIWSPDGQPVLTLPQTRPVSRLFWSADRHTLTVLAQGERGLRRWDLQLLKGELGRLGVDAGLP